jgi:hypothetical protein
VIGSQASGELGGNAPILPQRVDWFLNLMHYQASNAAENLNESWKRPVRPNMRLEHLALSHSVALERYCTRAIEREDTDPHSSPPLLPLPEEYGGPETRYAVEAAILMIPRLVPFTHHDLERLRAVDTHPETMAEREPELVADWHRWLWSNNPKVPHPADEHGQASLLAIAASRLSDNLQEVLGFQRD